MKSWLLVVGLVDYWCFISIMFCCFFRTCKAGNFSSVKRGLQRNLSRVSWFEQSYWIKLASYSIVFDSVVTEIFNCNPDVDNIGDITLDLSSKATPQLDYCVDLFRHALISIWSCQWNRSELDKRVFCTAVISEISSCCQLRFSAHHRLTVRLIVIKRY